MTHILISGAGVAGPALAHWLRRCGADVTVVERAPALREGGQGIDIRGAARTVVERMGLMDAVRAAHTGVRGVRQVDVDGRVRVEMAADTLGHSGGIVADVEILRADLVRLLVDSAEGIEYVFGDSVTALEPAGTGVRVSFERAASRVFDAVVGADGVHSTVRRAAFPAGSWTLHDNGYHRAVFTVDNPPALDDWELMYALPAGNGVPGGRNAMLYPAHGGARGMVHFACPPMTYDRRDVAEQKAIVRRVFTGEAWHVPAMLDAMDRAEDFYLERHQRVDAPVWHHGPVTLLGDACTGGSVGMGTSMALVGAYVLAGELATAGGDPAVAFPAYQARMQPYARANLKPFPGGVKGFLPSSARAIRTGQAMMRLLLRSPLGPVVMGGTTSGADAITLPDYSVPAVEVV